MVVHIFFSAYRSEFIHPGKSVSNEVQPNTVNESERVLGIVTAREWQYRALGSSLL